MKRLAILTAVLVIIPIAAMARMSTLSDNAMGVISGQVGITMDWDSKIEDGYIAISDSDGFGTTKYQYDGSFTFGDFIINGGTTSTNMAITGLEIDVGHDGTKGYLGIGLPRILGLVESGAVMIGTGPNQPGTDSGTLGRLTLGSINIAPTSMKVYPH